MLSQYWKNEWLEGNIIHPVYAAPLEVYVQSAKILLLPPKCEIIMLWTKHSFLQYCDSNMGLSLLLLVKLSFLILFASFLLSVLCFFFWWLCKIIALPTIAIAIVFALEPIYKTHTKMEANRLRPTTFAITKLVTKIISHFDGSNNIFVDCT